ncbi:histidine phosphatase family protein [Chitinasiproducens palmae]|uniref:Alpha-ribazole phosphatase n=1 Tax=Chitinasiproducens palmae TaxID=1770053 RepID=A0A1H2PRX1_9BURK|nr:histidine phosphatase family protein [Chitinasiproducens palmae]SDV49685.1 alpha-ribazole phosphatase [Chitinasiproducens palmae]
MTLILVRHPPVAVAKGTCYGRTDVALAVPAVEAAAALAARLRRRLPGVFASQNGAVGHLSPDEETVPRARVTILTSPALRCRTVAAALAASLEVRFADDERLREMDFGVWEMQRWDQIERASIDAWAADLHGYRAHGGETLTAFLGRLRAWLPTLDRLGNRPDPGATVCVVIAHAGVIRLLAALMLARAPSDCLAWPLDYNGLCVFERGDDDAWRLARWNDID